MDWSVLRYVSAVSGTSSGQSSLVPSGDQTNHGDSGPRAAGATGVGPFILIVVRRWASPSAAVSKARASPSGDHSGPVSSAGELVRFRSPVPSAPITNTSRGGYGIDGSSAVDPAA